MPWMLQTQGTYKAVRNTEVVIALNGTIYNSSSSVSLDPLSKQPLNPRQLIPFVPSKMFHVLFILAFLPHPSPLPFVYFTF